MNPLRLALFTLIATALGVAGAAADPGAPIDPRVEAALAGSLLDVPAPAAAGDLERPSRDAFGAADERAAEPPAAAESNDPLTRSFGRFCDEWRQKLEARERRNAGMIEWAEGTDWVQGSYIGYAPTSACAVEAADTASPVGRLSYLEVRYERRGSSIDAALRGKPEAVETTEVTEFFRYGENGEWLY